MNDDMNKDAHAASEDCDCAPTSAERRSLWPSAKVSRRGAIAVGALSAIAVTAFGITGNVPAAHAADYPSWDDVQRAKANEAAKAAEITRIEALIAKLTQEAAAAEEAARKAGEEFYAAQQAYFEQADKAQDLQSQADEQAEIAAESAQKAGQVANQIYRNSGDDAALELFLSNSDAGTDDLLARLGSMDKLLEYNRAVADKAAAARDSAQSLSDQAAKARDERDRLQKIAEQKMVAAQKAADAAQAALQAKQDNLGTLQAQLAALKDKTTQTVAAYQEGERKRKEEEARRRKAEEERRKKEAAAGGGGGGGGQTASSGWSRPHGGYISSGYGRRPPEYSNGVWRSTTHYGTDLANGCGAPIYAAASGKVVYAGYNGGYGNYIKIDHGGGTGTGYAHIRPGGILVGWGQHVRSGQLIAYAGNTGASQGCHLHFEVYRGGGAINPVPFMSARGVRLG